MTVKKNTEGKGNVYIHKECVTREKGETIALSKIKLFKTFMDREVTAVGEAAPSLTDVGGFQ